MEKENKKTVPVNVNAFIALGVAIKNAKEVMGKKCEYCGCYDGIHKSNCSFILKH